MAQKIVVSWKVLVAVALVPMAYWLSLSKSSPAAEGFTVEPKTGITFEQRSEGLDLLGVGVRVKKIGPIPVKVYAAGLYGGSKRDYAGLTAPKSGKRSLRLVFARDVGGKTIVDALGSVKKVDENVRETFKTVMLQLLGPTLKRGEQITLSCPARASSLAVDVLRKSTAKDTTSVHGRDLCDGVFDLFLGPKDPVSPALVASVKATLSNTEKGSSSSKKKAS